MRCPFPGMDPYLERPELWPDFHDRLITHIGVALQSMLRPKYATLTQHRLYVVEMERAIWPDVSMVRSPRPAGEPGTPAAVAFAPDKPLVIDFFRDEVRQRFLTIIAPASGSRVVTAIEVLSPDNKASGPGRDSYLEKREELWESGASLVEIDLLRQGKPTVWAPPNKVEKLAPWRYLAVVTRYRPCRHEIYAFNLADRLPRLSIPLRDDDPDVVLDLQSPFENCWDTGPYPELLRYDGPPPGGEISASEIGWCEERVQGI